MITICVLVLLCYGNAQDKPKSVLTVSPSWLNPGASVTLSCEVKPSSAGWMFYWYKAVPDLSKNSYRYELLSGSINGTVETSFIIHGQKHTAGFACRAGRGNPEDFGYYSQPKFIWSTDEGLLLVSPVHPVTEGASVTLSCRRRGENKLSDVIFYHNDKLIQNDSRGELKISAVSQSDEGFYKCEHSGEVSPQSWMGVKAAAPRPENASLPVLLLIGSVSGVSLIIILLCCFKQSKGRCCFRFIQSERRAQDSNTNYNQTGGSHNLYDSVRPSADPGNDADDAQSVIYSLIEFKNSGQRRRRPEPEGGAVYSEVNGTFPGEPSSAAADVIYSVVGRNLHDDTAM